MADITVPKWTYQDTNIQGSVTQQDFTRADRTIIYTAKTPLPSEQSVTMQAIGLIQGMSHSESKQLQIIFELGSAAPMIIPGLTQGQISLQRVLLNGLDFLNSIYHGIDSTNLTQDNILRSIRDVNRPFDMLMAKYPVLEDTTTGTTAVTTVLFRGCQIQSRSESISAGGVVTLEQLSIVYATIPKVTFNYGAPKPAA
jgi:hypothetical protein